MRLMGRRGVGAMIAAGPGKFDLAAPGLVLTGKLVSVNHTEYVADLDMQDPRCDLSKSYIALDKAAKDFFAGRHMASHSDCRATAELADIFHVEHGAIKRYLDRSDAQNKSGPSVLTARRPPHQRLLWPGAAFRRAPCVRKPSVSLPAYFLWQEAERSGSS
jgi:hypothetical protein